MIKVICITDYYLPGFKGGGPIRTIANMRTMLRDQLEISIFTRDRDLGSNNKYTGIQENCWTETAEGPIFYAAPSSFNASGLLQATKGKSYDLLYLNSFFSYRGSIELYHKFKSIRILVAPRGEFSIGALSLKSFKKQTYLKICRFMGFYNDIFWHASTIREKEDIARQFPKSDERIYIAEDPVEIGEPLDTHVTNTELNDEVLRITFISRISPIKNLDGLLRILAGTTSRIYLGIYGPIEDAEYWDNCQRLIALLPVTVEVSYKGILEPRLVSSTFAEYDLFAFPSRGENFGHVIFESLRAGTPVLVSEQTPWREDCYGALTILPISNENAWAEYLNSSAHRDLGTKIKLRKAARKYAEIFANSSGITENNIKMFLSISGKNVF